MCSACSLGTGPGVTAQVNAVPLRNCFTVCCIVLRSRYGVQTLHSMDAADGKCVSQSFILVLLWVYSCSPMYESHPAHFWLSVRKLPHVAVQWVCLWAEGSSGAFCVTICKDHLKILPINYVCSFFPGMGQSEHGWGIRAVVPNKDNVYDKRREPWWRQVSRGVI